MVRLPAAQEISLFFNKSILAVAGGAGIIHLHVVPRFTMRGNISPLPNISLFRAQGQYRMPVIPNVRDKQHANRSKNNIACQSGRQPQEDTTKY